MPRKKRNIQLLVFAAIGYLTVALVGGYIFYNGIMSIIK